MRRRRAGNGVPKEEPPSAPAAPASPPPTRDGAMMSANDFRRFDESPRQVVSGLTLLLALTGIAYNNGNGDRRDGGSDGVDGSPGESFRSAAGGVLLLLMAYCFLNTRDGRLKNPHPGFWRMLHGSTLWYAMMAAMLLVVHPDDGVTMMGWLFPGIERTERGPMEGVGANLPIAVDDGGAGGAGGEGGTLGMDHLDCDITKSNIRRQIFGLWFFAHAIGWWAKMLMLRDLWTCLVYSTVFELIELTLQCLVPEFQECWWDSVILDWLVANLLIGMNLGMLTQRVLNWPALNWAQDHPWMFKLKLARFAKALTPSSWIEYNWNPDNDPVSLVLNAVIWMLMCVGEVNSFFLINIFQLPRDHAFNVLRQVFFCFAALPACEEWYEYTRHVRVYNTGYATREYKEKYLGRKPRIGQTVWLLMITIGLETAAVLKYCLALDLFSNARRFDVGFWGPWASSTTLFFCYLSVHCWLFRRGVRRFPGWLEMLKWSSALPLLLLCRLYAF